MFYMFKTKILAIYYKSCHKLQTVKFPWIQLVSWGQQLEPCFYSLFANWLYKKSAELAMRSSCLLSIEGCTHNYHWITLILQETWKHDDSQASSGLIRRIFLGEFQSRLMDVYPRWTRSMIPSFESRSHTESKNMLISFRVTHIAATGAPRVLKYFNSPH